VRKYEDLAAQGYTCQWYQLILSDAGEQYIAMEGETGQRLNVTYPLREERYYCIYKAVDGSEKMSDVFVIVAQTTDTDAYLSVLYEDQFWNADDTFNTRAIYDHMNTVWNVEVNGVNLAEKVVQAWWAEKQLAPDQFDLSLLCSCVVTGAVASDSCMLAPGAGHVGTCGWYSASPTLALEEKTNSDGSHYYTLSMTVNGETTVVATTEMLDGVHHYFKDAKTGIFVAWLYTDEKGVQWIVPLASEE
jgi:hypothetical protein